MTQGFRSREGNPRLEGLPVRCRHCLAEGVNLKDSGINYNGGDSVIPAHLHVNLIYRCVNCDARFVVRGRLFPAELYYGDILPDGTVCDASAATQIGCGQDELRTGQSIIEPVGTHAAEAAGIPFE